MTFWPIAFLCKCSHHTAQEFEFQGHEMKGPAASLFGAGAGGRHQNNIKRDWFRKMGNMDFDHRAPWKIKRTCIGNFLLTNLCMCSCWNMMG